MGKEWDRLLKDPSGSPHARQHSVSFVNPGNPTCRNCGGLKSLESEGSGGRTKCRCDVSDFPNHLLPRAQAMQEWHHAWATEALRVLKPGGFLVAAGGTRTFHRLVSAIEDAGFEIRDCIAHMYGSGFPKSHNGEWGGTALKPGFEPWTLARKPLIGSVEQNWREHGTGALNIDATRIEPLRFVCLGCGQPSETRNTGNKGIYCSKSCRADFERKGRSQPQRYEQDGYWLLRWTEPGGTKRRPVRRHQFEHRRVWEQHNGPLPEGFVVHHINGNRKDNRIENLQAMRRTDHVALHREMAK
jgi:hypothetical protein